MIMILRKINDEDKYIPKTPVPFLLTKDYTLRKYQHIGLDWLGVILQPTNYPIGLHLP